MIGYQHGRKWRNFPVLGPVLGDRRARCDEGGLSVQLTAGEAAGDVLSRGLIVLENREGLLNVATEEARTGSVLDEIERIGADARELAQFLSDLARDLREFRYDCEQFLSLTDQMRQIDSTSAEADDLGDELSRRRESIESAMRSLKEKRPRTSRQPDRADTAAQALPSMVDRRVDAP